MINVSAALQRVPHFEKFCSVRELNELVEGLRKDARFTIILAGTSSNEVPIYHLRFGAGSVKVLVVGFPHPNEPVGGMTVFSLLTMLAEKNSVLATADVEWHVVPCIDPDGAMLNEGWSQEPFSIRNYLKYFHRQELRDQIEASFPIAYKRLHFNEPTKETNILKEVLGDVLPDLYFSLHNTTAGGVYYCLTQEIDRKYYQQLYQILRQHHLPLQAVPYLGEWCTRFADGVREPFATRKFYDFIERTAEAPEAMVNAGACSWDYLADIKAEATTFLAELPYITHPAEGSQRKTSMTLRQFKLRVDADNKFLATVILEEWERVKHDLNTVSPFYKKIMNGLVLPKQGLPEGLPIYAYKTRDILFNPNYATTMTEGEQFNVCLIERLPAICNSYEFVRLLKDSQMTPAVQQAIDRLEPIFEEALADLGRHVDFDAFKVIEHDTLVKVQLGSGLIVLNSLLDRRSHAQEMPDTPVNAKVRSHGASWR